MKNIGKLLIKAFAVFVLFTGISVGLSTVGVSSVSEARAAVSYQQVYQYLVDHGYTVITLDPVPRSLNWIAHTTLNGFHLMSTVHVEGDQIIVITDAPM